MKETEKYISHSLTGSLRYCTTIHRRRQFSQRTCLQIEPIKCLQIIGPNLFTTQAQSSKMSRVGQHSQVWGGFGGVGVEIGFCHWTGLAPHLHLHLQLCSPPIGWPPTHIRNGQSNARNGEAELGAGGCRQPPRRVLGAATARGAASPRAFGPGTTTERVEMEAVCGVEGAVGMEME